MMFDKIKLSLKIAKEIKQGLWVPFYNDISHKYLTLDKKNSDFVIWAGNGITYCRIYKPEEYNPFGIIGTCIVHRAVKKAIKRAIAIEKNLASIKRAEITKRLAGEQCK